MDTYYLIPPNPSEDKLRAIKAFEKTLKNEMPYAVATKAWKVFYNTIKEADSSDHYGEQNLETKTYVQFATPAVIAKAAAAYQKALTSSTPPSPKSEEEIDPLAILEGNFHTLPSRHILKEETSIRKLDAIRTYSKYLSDNIASRLIIKVRTAQVANYKREKEEQKNGENNILAFIVTNSTKEALAEAEKIYDDKLANPSHFAKTWEEIAKIKQDSAALTERLRPQTERDTKALAKMHDITKRWASGVYSDADQVELNRITAEHGGLDSNSNNEMETTNSKGGAIVGVVILATVFGGGATLVVAAIAGVFFGTIAALIFGGLIAAGTIALSTCIIKSLSR